MRFLADENIPFYTVRKLRNCGCDITWVTEISPGISDREVIKLAESGNRIIITFDRDFGTIVFKSKYTITTGIIYLKFSPKNSGEPADVLLHYCINDKIIFTGNFTVIDKDHIRQRSIQ